MTLQKDAIRSESPQRNPAETEQGRPGHWLAHLPAFERPILLLRGLALLLVLILHWFDLSEEGVLFPVPYVALAVASYFVLLVLLMRYVRWLRRPLNCLAIDTLVATLAVYVTGGYHSSFFVLYVFIAIGAAFYLELARTIAVGLGIGLIYVGACYVNPAGLESPYAGYILAAKLLLLLIVSVLCGLLLEQLRREHEEADRERERVARLRALEELQAGFVSSVSHELRTPLTCIKTSVDLLRDTNAGLSPEQVDLIHTIGHHLGRLEALVTDLLEITKLEAGQITLTRQPTDLRHIVGRVVDAFRPLTDAKTQAIDLDWPPDPALADVDRRRIEQVMTNIVSNAIKFTPKGGHIRVRVSQEDGNVQVCIADDGPGIPPEEQAHVFDKFYVVADRRGLSGLGLGLYIAREMVGLHGGRIWVTGRPGEGSTFCFTVPAMTRED